MAYYDRLAVGHAHVICSLAQSARVFGTFILGTRRSGIHNVHVLIYGDMRHRLTHSRTLTRRNLKAKNAIAFIKQDVRLSQPSKTDVTIVCLPRHFFPICLRMEELSP